MALRVADFLLLDLLPFILCLFFRFVSFFSSCRSLNNESIVPLSFYLVLSVFFTSSLLLSHILSRFSLFITLLREYFMKLVFHLYLIPIFLVLLKTIPLFTLPCIHLKVISLLNSLSAFSLNPSSSLFIHKPPSHSSYRQNPIISTANAPGLSTQAGVGVRC